VRLAVVLPGLRPEIGGGFTFVEEVAQALERATLPPGLEVVLLTDAQSVTARGRLPRVALPAEGASDRLRGRLSRVSQRVAKWVGDESVVDRAARAAGAAIVWFPTGGSRAIELPFVATVWDVQHRTHPWFPEVSQHGLWRQRDEMTRELLGRAALVVCGTEAGAAELDRYYALPRKRVVMAPHPTPGWALETGVEDASKVPEAPFFLYPAQFWAHKNHANLISALAARRRAGSRAVLVLVGGDQGIRAQVEAHARALGVADAVRFAGFVSRDALRALYRRALGLVYASFSGPENLPPLEAFALGCPVANADFPGAREQLGDAAIYFDPMVPMEMAAAMDELESNSARRTQLIDAGAVIARERSGDAFVQRVLNSIAALAPMIDPWAKAPAPTGTR